MMGMVEQLERAQLGIKLEEFWCGALVCRPLCAGDGLRDGAADYVGGGSSVYDKVEDEVQHRKSGKREGGTSWKIDEMMEEVKEFKYLGVMANKAEEWVGKVMWMSRVNGQVKVGR